MDLFGDLPAPETTEQPKDEETALLEGGSDVESEHSNASSGDVGHKRRSEAREEEDEPMTKMPHLDKVITMATFNELPADCLKLNFSQIGKLIVLGQNLELVGLHSKMNKHQIQIEIAEGRIEVEIEKTTSVAVRGEGVQITFSPIIKPLLDLSMPMPPAAMMARYGQAPFNRNRGAWFGGGNRGGYNRRERGDRGGDRSERSDKRQ